MSSQIIQNNMENKTEKNKMPEQILKTSQLSPLKACMRDT